MEKTHNIAYSGLICALLAVSAFIKIPLQPVPLTLQPFIVLITPMIFGIKVSFIGFFAYLLLGLIGLPIFANGGGIAYVLQPTFGYLVGFLLATLPIGYFSKNSNFISNLIGGLLGLLVIYGLGVSYLYLNLHYIQHKNIPLNTILKIGFLLPIPFDILKLTVASFLSLKIKKMIKRQQ